MTEEWRDIEGFEGIYQISSWGRIKELDHINSKGIHRREKLIRKCPVNNGDIAKTVAETFPELIYIVSKPEDDDTNDFYHDIKRFYVYHKDGNRYNNHADNLYYIFSFPEPKWNNQACYCVETGIGYWDYWDAKKATGANIKDIKEAQKSKKLTAAGYHWE